MVLVGAGTARAENYGPVRLTEAQHARRHSEGRTAPPPIALVRRSSELPARLFEDVDQPPILITCAESEQRRDLTSDKLRRVLVTGEESVDVAQAVALLPATACIASCASGGPILLDELVEAGAVDEICVTLAPKLAASQPVSLRLQPSRLPVPVDMQLGHALVHEDYLFLKYHR